MYLYEKRALVPSSAGLQTRQVPLCMTMPEQYMTRKLCDYRRGQRTLADGRKRNNIMLRMPEYQTGLLKRTNSWGVNGSQYFIMYARLQMFHSYRKLSTIQPAAIAPPAHLNLSL
jgi:hypothetical protein